MQQPMLQFRDIFTQAGYSYNRQPTSVLFFSAETQLEVAVQVIKMEATDDYFKRWAWYLGTGGRAQSEDRCAGYIREGIADRCINPIYNNCAAIGKQDVAGMEVAMTDLLAIRQG